MTQVVAEDFHDPGVLIAGHRRRVGRDENVRERPQRRAWRQRLDPGDVERGTTEVTGVQSLDQRRLVDHEHVALGVVHAACGGCFTEW
jgi:hypothetical protein